MKLSFKSINSKLDSFLEKSLKIRSSNFRLAIIISLYIVATIGLFGILPFILGIYLILTVIDKIEHNPSRIAVSAVIILFTLAIGIPWARATYSPDQNINVKNVEESVQREEKTESSTPTPIPSPTQTPAPEPSAEQIVNISASVEEQNDKIQPLVENTPEPVTPQPATPEAVVPEPASQEQCDPNYSGACVPIATDVDCAGGSGNGPAYVQGPVQVIGRDIYDLDRDGNGIGCES